MSLLPLRTGDYEQWLSLWKRYLRFYEVEISTDTTQATWSRLISDAEPLSGALAWEGDHAIGMVHWISHRSTWTIGNYGYMQDLFVDMQCRDRGVGRMLIEWVYAEAKQNECAKVYWLTDQTNLQAMKLYDRIAKQSGSVHYARAL